MKTAHKKNSLRPPTLPWVFPSTKTHHGIPLGNGLFGALLWGEGEHLRITINRQDYWDHRGGIVFGEEATYCNLRRWLAEGNESELRRVFEGSGNDKPGEPRRPTRLPMGRVDVRLPGASLQAGALELRTGTAKLKAGNVTARAIVTRENPILVLKFEGKVDPVVSPVPPDAPEVKAYFSRYGFPEPQIFSAPNGGGWVQTLPADPALCVAWRVEKSEPAAELFVIALYGDSAEDTRARAERLLDHEVTRGFERLARDSAKWWKKYWSRCAAVRLPAKETEELFWIGMYKLAGLSMPGTPAATLQGPWVEEYRMPPWSADYHFNINVQECYWPAFSGNVPEALEPLWEMLKGWEPLLRRNAKAFLGIEDGLMLPHATDDRGTCMGGFWTGAVDHGSTAWTGQLMWLYYRHTLDGAFLRDTAYPFLKGSMRTYEAMLERDPSGTWSLPVSVSPEFGGAGMKAWGKNASFQLAIIHFLARALVEASQILGVDEAHRARWRELDEQLPPGSVFGEGDKARLALWDGKPLTESHRHHSHLAGIYPFDTLDFGPGGQDEQLVTNSIREWTRTGMGAWTGWCVPWAAIIRARLGQGEAAELLLQIFRKVFRQPGRATTHDAVLPGLTAFDRSPDIMQIDATMGAAAAVMEMLAHTRGGVLRVLAGVPADWPVVRFERIRVEGAFLVSAERAGGQTQWVRVTSLAGQRLKMQNPFTGELVDVPTERGETIEFRPEHA